MFLGGSKLLRIVTFMSLLSLVNLQLNFDLFKQQKIYLITTFSLYTGLRIVDIINMKWKDVKASEKGWYFEITQKKTNHTIKNSFPKFARELLAERKQGDKAVFSGLQGFNYQNSYRQLTYDRFKRWRDRAGVSKDKTLHTFRHTYANNLYKRCNNIYEVSKALGHKKLETTLQFYAPESKFDQNSAFIEDAYNFV